MARGNRRIRAALGVAFLCTVGAGCKVDNDLVNTNTGTSRILFVDPDLAPQSTKHPNRTIQVAQWEILQADAVLSTEGAPNPLDLTFEEPCIEIDTAVISPFTEGKCASGIVLGVNTEPEQIALQVRFRMQVRRGKPVILNSFGDFDGDGIDNGSDVCPYVFNPAQLTQSCTVTDVQTGAQAVDADGDGVTDKFDNCVFTANKDQADTSGVSAIGLPDLIGDACREQTADVVGLVDFSPEMEATFAPVEMFQPLNALTFITVDLNTAESMVDANGDTTCDWDAGICTLDTSKLQFCFNTNVFAANAGC